MIKNIEKDHGPGTPFPTGGHPFPAFPAFPTSLLPSPPLTCIGKKGKFYIYTPCPPLDHDPFKSAREAQDLEFSEFTRVQFHDLVPRRKRRGGGPLKNRHS